MNIPAKILSDILDNNAKDLISNVNVALLDKVQSRIEEMRKRKSNSAAGRVMY